MRERNFAAVPNVAETWKAETQINCISGQADAFTGRKKEGEDFLNRTFLKRTFLFFDALNNLTATQLLRKQYLNTKLMFNLCKIAIYESFKKKVSLNDIDWLLKFVDTNDLVDRLFKY